MADDNLLQQRIIEGIARHAGTALGAILVAHGYMTQSDTSQLSNGVAEIAGVAVMIVMGYLSSRNKKTVEKEVAVATYAAPGTPREDVEAAAKRATLP